MTGSPSSMGFVGWTGMCTGSGARSSQVTPHDQPCVFFVPSLSRPPVPENHRYLQTRPFPGTRPNPPGHLPLPSPFNPPVPRPPASAAPGDSQAAQVATSAQNTFSKAWVLRQP